MYVIQFNNGLYWCGYNSVSSQLRKAKIYTNIKMVKDSANEALKRYKLGKITVHDSKISDKPDTFNILSVSLVVTGIMHD